MKIPILILGNESSDLQELSQYLGQQGCRTLLATDAPSAIRMLGEHDVKAAVVGSIGLLHGLLSGFPQATGIPIVLLEESEGAAAGQGLTADEMLPAGAHPKQIFSSIVRLLSHKGTAANDSGHLDSMIDKTYKLLNSLRDSLGIAVADHDDRIESKHIEEEEDAAEPSSGQSDLVPPDIRENLRVMIVDGDDEFCSKMKEAFAAKDYTVECAPNGQIALEDMRKNHAQILICELRVPVLSGKALIAITKKEFRETAVVVVTSSQDDMPLKEALELGVDEYLTKPVKKDDLLFIAERAYYRHLALIKSTLRSDRLRKLERELGRLRKRENALKEELSASRNRESKLRKELISARKAIAEIKQTLDGSGLRKLLGLE
ncbi:MAG: response regulator [Planctomycetota bacterium]